MLKKLSLFILVTLFLIAGSGLVAANFVQITVAQGADAVTLDPHGQNDQPSSRVRSQIYETLVYQDTDLQLGPGLALGWDHVDELVWDFYLRPGVMFHNGEILTAHDVKFTLDRLKHPDTASPGAFIVGFLDKVEVMDELTVRLHTKFPFAPLLNHLAHPVTGILNEKAVVEAGDDYGSLVVVGSGPFQFKSWSTGSHIVLEKFNNYWGELAKADQITFRNIPENTVRAIEVETGGVDIAYGIDPIDEMRLADVPTVVLSKHETLATSYIGFNAKKEPFDNVLVRQAINHAVDVDAIVEFIYTGQAVRATGPISGRVWGANPYLTPYEFDLDKAKAMLAEAGYPNGFSATIWTNDNPLRMQIAEMVQSDLGKIGVQIEVQVLEWGTYLADTGAGKHDMFILGWVSVTGDADYGLYALFHSSQFGNAGNRTFWSHPKVDAALDLGRSTADPEVRTAAYYEAQEIIAEEAPWIFLIATKEVNGVQANVEGFVPHPAGHHRLFNVTKK